ncbi:MAG TPA: D-alanyl-D-alanine carboxypeptidase/D-alanyl-D-alanine-endopeptidase [Nitrosospira sp.]|nr:D-alanyl-D-alanine carboxypeptidase/D-alanyl-D-alanine-endopeptidase [Nitrosospira sp.]
MINIALPKSSYTGLVLPLLLLPLFLPVAPAFSRDLPAPVHRTLRQAGILESAVSVYIHEIGTSQPLLQHNAGIPMNPASVMKLVTTYAGLELLGPAYTWKTELYADGLRDGDTLRGNLIIKGYGDPKLNLENFWLLTRRLRQTGLREIAGDLILDTNYFQLPSVNPAEFDGKPHRAYNVLPEALLVNYRAVSLRLIPTPENGNVRVIVDPLPALLDLRNSLTLTPGACGDWRDALATDIRANRENDGENHGRVSIALNGTYATDCGEKNLFLSVHENAYYIQSLFKQLWEEQGGTFHGRGIPGTVPDGLLPIEIHQSPPLADIVRDINKFSNNTAARQLYLALGVAEPVVESTAIVRATTLNPAVAGGQASSEPMAPATLAKADASIRRWLASKRLHFPELVMENGSGLSRNERISARHVGQLLLTAFQSPVMPEFISSLPIAAVDGTMKKRLNGSATAGQAHIKTGSLEGVQTMAGYMRDQSGKRLVVVFFVNHPNAGRAQAAMDMLLHWLYEQSVRSRG